MKSKPKFYVTHIIVPNIPESGYDQVFYYSATDESYCLRKYYWGKGNNSFDNEFINDLEKKGEIFKLVCSPYPMELADDKTLWVDYKGSLFIADINDPYKNQKELMYQEQLRKNSLY